MHFHWQNLNEKAGGRLGLALRHGRAWFSFLGGSLNWEWSLGRWSAGASLSVNQSEDVGFGFHVAIPLVLSLWVHVVGFRPVAALARFILRNTEKRWEDRELSVRVHDWAIWWTTWLDPMGGWDSRVPKWRDGSFHIDDLVLGKARFSERVIEPKRQVTIGMPEASYEATVEITERCWKRPRWFAVRRIGSKVDIPDGIPFPGKGENSWDCGEDAIFGQSNGATSVEAAIAAVVESALRSRRRYGGSVNWIPQARKIA